MSLREASEASEAQISKAGFQFSLMDMDFSPKVEFASWTQRAVYLARKMEQQVCHRAQTPEIAR